MKCPKCTFDQKVSNGMVCEKCDYRFAFNPKLGKSFELTDGKFLAAIRRAGQNGTIVFTENQLYCGYVSLGKSPRVQAAIISVILILILVGVLIVDSTREYWPFYVLLCIALMYSIWFAFWGRPSAMARGKFDGCIGLWKKFGNEIPGLIEYPSLRNPPPEWEENDIYDYGVERVLIVQHDLLVDLMVLNNQHAELRMLVMSMSGYPSYLQSQLGRMLEERSDLPVFLLHDADKEGTLMGQAVRELQWVDLAKHPIVDLGFFPADFQKLNQTANFRGRNARSGLPADALRYGSLMMGLSACFESRATFAEELVREKENQMSSGSSFG